MAVKNMADYLSEVTADYTTTELSVAPHNILYEEVDKNQNVHRADGGNIAVASLSSTALFKVTLQWIGITESDAGTIFDMWTDSSKANGREKTFYWQHPTDGNTYTARFLTPLKRGLSSQFAGAGRREIQQVTLSVEGKKPA